MAAWLSHFMILDREAVFSTPGASVLYPLPCIASPETFGKKSLVGTRSRKGAGRYAGPPSRGSVRETGKSLVGTRDRQIGGRYAGPPSRWSVRETGKSGVGTRAALFIPVSIVGHGVTIAASRPKVPAASCFKSERPDWNECGATRLKRCAHGLRERSLRERGESVCRGV